MSFSVTYDLSLDCILTTMDGSLDQKQVSAFFEQVGRTAAEHSCKRVLSDLRNARIVAPLADIYEMASAIEKKGILTSFKRAIVISKDQEDYDFWKTVCHNTGHANIRLFHDYDEAMAWVLAQPIKR